MGQSKQRAAEEDFLGRKDQTPSGIAKTALVECKWELDRQLQQEVGKGLTNVVFVVVIVVVVVNIHMLQTFNF